MNETRRWKHVLLVILRAEFGVVAHGLGDAAGQGADAGVSKKDFAGGHGELVPTQFFVGEQFGESHKSEFQRVAEESALAVDV